MNFKKTDFGYICQDRMFYKDDERFGMEPSIALEWSNGLVEAIKYMVHKFGVNLRWGLTHPAVNTLVYLANRVGIDPNVVAISYHVQIVTPNDSFIKIMIYKDGNPHPLQVVFYNEDKMIGVISPIPLPQFFNKQTHRRKRTKKSKSFLRKFPHTELLEASLFIEKAVITFLQVHNDAILTWAYLNEDQDVEMWLEK